MKIPFMLLLLILPVTSNPVYAQFSFHEEVIFENDDNEYYGFALAELNNDGKMDLILHAGAKKAALICFKSDKLGNQWSKSVIAKHSPGGSLITGDIDKDGDADIVACKYSDTSDVADRVEVMWYENVNDTSQWKTHHIASSPDFVKDIKLAHFNDDKLIDIAFITNYDEHLISVYTQTEAGGWNKVFSTSLNKLHEGLDVGDIDGNGKTDIVTNGYWIKNTEDTFSVDTIDSKWHNQPRNEWRSNATKVECTDLDRDGKAEVIMSHAEMSGYPVSWYDYNAETDEWQENIIYEGMSAVHTLQAGDIDADGDIDVLAGENGHHHATQGDEKRPVYIFLNEGDNKKWGKHLFSEKGLYDGRLVDVNSDGRLDIAGHHGHKTNGFKIWYTFLEL